MNGTDFVNMEYEARVFITPEQYYKIKEKYLKEHPDARKILNENYYFDTEDLYLTEHQMVLRIRKINHQKSELTLKIQKEEGCLEINHPLTLIEESELLNSNVIPDLRIIEELAAYNINPKDIKLITSLVTDRIEIQFDKYLLVIDKNEYRGKTDFNLEVESDSDFAANFYLNLIISEFGIENKKDYITKSKRAIYNL